MVGTNRNSLADANSKDNYDTHVDTYNPVKYWTSLNKSNKNKKSLGALRAKKMFIRNAEDGP